MLAFLCGAYDEENIGTEEKPDVRTVLHFHPALAPVKIGVLPLSKKLNDGAEKVFEQLCKKYNCEFDGRGNIGKRYRRQDEIGTPFCVHIDFDSEEDFMQLLFVTVIQWNRFAFRLLNWMLISQTSLHSNVRS